MIANAPGGSGCLRAARRQRIVDDCRHRDPRTANAGSPPTWLSGTVIHVNVTPERLPVTQLTPGRWPDATVVR